MGSEASHWGRGANHQLPADGVREMRPDLGSWGTDSGNPGHSGDIESEVIPLIPDYPALVTVSESSVTVLRVADGDAWIANSARVSHRGDFIEDEKQNAGLINSLMQHRHGVPFESGYLEVHVACPLFVAGQILRHRIGWSFSVKSGRYGQMGEVFYLPDARRPLINIGSSMRPKLSFGETPDTSLDKARLAITKAYGAAWGAYHDLLDAGVTNEVARVVLPEGIFTELWARCNPRSLMAFLSLRVSHEANTYETHPQQETEQLAMQLDDILRHHWPITHAAFEKHGRVAP